MSTLYYYQPVYRVEFWNSAGNVQRHIFGTGSAKYPTITSFRVKPGMTSAVGSFEIELHDTGSDNNRLVSGSAFADIDVFDYVLMWYGYTGSGIALDYYNFNQPMFVGHVDSKEVNFSVNGCSRRFIGRDVGASLFETIERRAFTGSCRESIKQLITDAQQINTSDTYLTASNDAQYFFVASDKNAFECIKEVDDFNNKDSYVDTGSAFYFHYFDRQSMTDNSTPFVEGTNIISYRYIKDLGKVKNDIYVFGLRTPDNQTGSDYPISHDAFTEAPAGAGLTDQPAYWYTYVDSSPTFTNAGYEFSYLVPAAVASGSTSVFTQAYTTSTTDRVHLHYDLTHSGSIAPLMIRNGDGLHFYGQLTAQGSLQGGFFVRLETNSGSDYYECALEAAGNGQPLNQCEMTLKLGPSYEGLSLTGSPGTHTGSYRWTRHGSPDWYTIRSVDFSGNCPQGAVNLVGEIVDGMYFAIPYQYHAISGSSVTSYGLRTLVINDDKINSQAYCLSYAQAQLNMMAQPSSQIEMETVTRPYIIGTQYPITIKSEGISAALYELIDVEHNWQNGKLTSKCLFSNQKYVRTPIPLLNLPVQQARMTATMDAFYNHFQGTYPTGVGTNLFAP